MREEYNRVKGKYLIEKRQADGRVKRGPQTRNTWYEGDLSILAQTIGRQAEYDAFVSDFNGCVHTSASPFMRGQRFRRST